MSQYKVSIIVNTYNGERYVAKIIETLKPYESDVIEFILVDDGSKEEDTTAEQFKNAFHDAIIIKEENEGLAAARNKGASIANGEFLQFIDIDDAIAPNKVLSQYDFAKSVAADVVYSDWRMMIVDTENHHVPENWIMSNSQDDILVALIKGWWNPFHSYLIKTEVYNNVGGSNKALVNAQDFDVMVRIAASKYNFAYLSGNYSEYYRYETVVSLARGNRTQYWKDNEYTVLNTVSIIKEKDKNLSEPLIQAACDRLFYIARNVYKIDKTWNKKIINTIKELSNTFVPTNQSKSFLSMYKLFGYNNTERLLSIIKLK
jgi:glycosyltransferase involved in cell wall biosynthesis